MCESVRQKLGHTNVGSQRRNVKSEAIDHPVVCLADLFGHCSQQFQFAYHYKMGESTQLTNQLLEKSLLHDC